MILDFQRKKYFYNLKKCAFKICIHLVHQIKNFHSIFLFTMISMLYQHDE